jgi:hypothetical protein
MTGSEVTAESSPVELLATTTSAIKKFQKSCDTNANLANHPAKFKAALRGAQETLPAVRMFLEGLESALAGYAVEAPELFPLFAETLRYIKDDAVLIQRTVEEVLPPSWASGADCWHAAVKASRPGVSSKVKMSVDSIEERFALLRASPICGINMALEQPAQLPKPHGGVTQTKVRRPENHL